MEDALKSEEHKKKVLLSCGYGENADTGFSAGSLVRLSWSNENENIPQVSHRDTLHL